MKKTAFCELTQKEYPIKDLVRADSIRYQIKSLIKNDYPEWSGDTGYINQEILNKYRNNYIQKLLEEEKGELTALDKEVLSSMKSEETLSRDINAEMSEKLSIGQQLADKVADFGGSWKFIIIFLVILGLWIMVNSYLLLNKPFDPYPYILMNLILSCIAALQAPVIMMSQNRQETKDRLRSQNDYQINLKAEIEIRQLHEKIDHINIQYGQRLFELQQIQIDLMEQILNKK